MIIGNIILAEEVLTPSGSQTLLNNPNNIFPVLATPAYISFGVLFVLSGIDFNVPHELTIEISEKDNDDIKTVIFKQRIDANPHGKDPHPTLSGNLSLRNVVIKNIGYHKVSLMLDNTPITETFINIIKTTMDR